MSTTTSVTPTKPAKKLRPYQTQACRNVWEAFSQRGVKRAGVCIPTGGGKTLTATGFVSPILRQYKGNCLWIAHRRELLDQAEGAFRENAPDLRLTRWDATNKDDSGDIVFASIGSTRTLKKDFLLVVIDETHHAAEADEEDEYTNMYAQLLQKLRWSHLIGLTATPTRLDGRSLALDEIVYSISYLDLVRKHRLARPIYMEMLTKEHVNLQIRGGEFTKQSLSKLDTESRNRKIAEQYVQNKAMHGKTLMFVTGVEHCEHMADMVRSLDPTVDLRVLTGKDELSVRRDITKWFYEGDQYAQKLLINCEVATEGYDVPTIKSIFLGRPTMSKVLWMQMVGRGARIIGQDFNVRTTDIVSREPAGDDGVEKFTFSNGATYYGEDFGPTGTDPDGTPLHRLHLHMDDEFYLVQVMDDITKFHSLVEEWQLDIRESTPEEIEEGKLNKALQEKKLRIEILEKEEDIEERDESFGELTDAKIRDLVGVLIISTYYDKNLGIPCDFERTVVLKRLLDFATVDCMIPHEVDVEVVDPATGQKSVEKRMTHEFDVEKYITAYTSCVSKAEFPFKIFEKIRMAFYFRFIHGRQRIRYNPTNTFHDTWKFVPITDITPESRLKHIQAAEELASETKTRNEEFNKKYADQQAQAELAKQVIHRAREILEEEDASKSVFNSFYWLNGTMKLVRVKDRRVGFLSDIEVDGPKTAGTLARHRRLLTKALQDLLDDPNSIVTVTPKGTTWYRAGELVTARNNE
jgi:superfamily II DNA or RNA helicase